MNRKELSERDICTKFITPALRQAGWDEMSQLREEVSFTNGRIIVRGKLVTRGKAKRADYILYYKPNIPLAVVEAKDNNCHPGDGLQQAIEYAEMLQLPFVFSSNGDGFVFHDRTITDGEIEKTLALDAFPSPAELWNKYRQWKGLPQESDALVLQDYYADGSGKGPRYYQASAVNAAVEAVAKGQNRLLLVMATGTPDHLAPVEGSTQEADSLPRGPEHPRRSDDGERLSSVRVRDGEAEHLVEGDRTRRWHEC